MLSAIVSFAFVWNWLKGKVEDLKSSSNDSAYGIASDVDDIA
jgi:hypothetical protein